MKLGYLIDLATAKFKEGWLHMVPVGKYVHPVYGDIEFSQDKLANMVRNFKANVRGQELDIDYDHKEHGGKAAGWIRDLVLQDDGIWGLIDWTEPAATAIQNGEYKYFSPEFDDEWEDPQGNKYKDVLFGGGITNRPFLKDLIPVNLSEVFAESRKEAKLDPKQLRQLLKLKEDATDSDVEAALKKLTDPPPPNDPPQPEPEPEPQPEPEPEPSDPELVKLAEKSPAVKLLMETNKAMAKTVANLSAKQKLSEARERVRKLTSTEDGKKFAIPLGVEEKLTEIFLTSDDETSDRVEKALSEVLEKGLVELGEHAVNDPARHGGDATKKFSDLIAQKMQSDSKIDYTEASRQVAKENPELFQQYREAAWLKAEEVSK